MRSHVNHRNNDKTIKEAGSRLVAWGKSSIDGRCIWLIDARVQNAHTTLAPRRVNAWILPAGVRPIMRRRAE